MENKMPKNLLRIILVFATALFINVYAHAQTPPPAPVETDTLAPFVTSSAVSVITTSSATAGGNVTNDGGAPVLERGIVYSSTNTTPTTADSKVIAGSGTGVFSQTITGLTGGTTYYIRAYATNVVGVSYGAVVSFTTTSTSPVVITNAISAITNTTATANGNISSSGGATVTERGIVYSSVNTSPTVTDTKITSGTGTGIFTQGIIGLVAGTVYYVRAYAVNSVGTSYGSVVSFTPAGASVTTDAPSAISSSSATMGGNVVSIGGSAVTERGVVYASGNVTPTITDTKVAIGSGIGTFSQSITSLAPGTQYSVRAYATNSAATNYGSIQTFTTQTTVSSINRTNAAVTNLALVGFTVVFAQPVTGLTAANLSFTASSGISNASITTVTGSGTTWNVTVYTGSGDGTLTLNLANSTGIAPGISTTLPFAGQVYTIDKTPPTLSAVTIASNNANASFTKTGDKVTVSFTTSETISTPVVTIAGQAATVANTSGNNWTATYTMASSNAEGTVAFNISFSDVAGNAGAPDSLTTNSSSVVFDKTPPAVSSINLITPSSNIVSSIQFTITFSEAVTGVDATDFSTTTTSQTGTTVASITGSGAVYTVTVNNGTGNGTIRLDLNSSGTGIIDSAGNPISGGFTTGQVYTIVKPTVKTTNPATICAPNTIDLTAAAVTAGSDAGLTFKYYTNTAATTTLASPSAVTTSGTYYITGTNSGGAVSDPMPVVVTINSFTKPQAGFNFDSYCINNPVTFTSTSVTTGTGSVSYQWSDNTGKTSIATSPSFTYTATGSVSMKLKVASTVCPNIADSITKAIPIEQPVPAVRIPTVNVIINEASTLQARSIAGATYLWAPATGLSSASIANPTTTLSAEQEYKVSVKVPSSCVTVDTLLTRIFDNRVYVANVFSPNGDGVNDKLMINLAGVNQLHYFKVFNRYSKLLFQTSDATIGWDGRFNGILQPIDTYVWVAEVVDKSGNTIVRSGNTTLLR